MRKKAVNNRYVKRLGHLQCERSEQTAVAQRSVEATASTDGRVFECVQEQACLLDKIVSRIDDIDAQNKRISEQIDSVLKNSLNNTIAEKLEYIVNIFSKLDSKIPKDEGDVTQVEVTDLATYPADEEKVLVEKRGFLGLGKSKWIEKGVD